MKFVNIKVVQKAAKSTDLVGNKIANEITGTASNKSGKSNNFKNIFELPYKFFRIFPKY